MILETWYEVKKMVFKSFDTMVETTFRIEDVLKEQGILANMKTITRMAKVTTKKIKERIHIGIEIKKWSIMEL